MTRPWQRPWRLATWLTACLLLSGLAAACGSGGQDAPPQTNSSETVRSARAHREASIMQQQQYQQQQQQSAASEQAVADDSKPTPDPTQEAVVASGQIDSGHRYGLPFSRNIVGDPEAPVLIVEYSDFQ